MTEPERRTQPQNIRAVVFDKDGTLFRFEEAWSSYCDRMLDFMAAGDPMLRRNLAEACGYDPMTREFQDGSAIIGSPIEEICALWSSRSPSLEMRALLTESAVVIADLRPSAVGDLQQLVANLIVRGLTLGLVTNDLERAARAQLADVGILEMFAFVCGSDSGFSNKPEADTILEFCRQTGVPPAEVAMVGDSLHDLLAGRAAGVGLNIGVLTGPARQSALKPHADHILASVMDLPELLAGQAP